MKNRIEYVNSYPYYTLIKHEKEKIKNINKND